MLLVLIIMIWISGKQDVTSEISKITSFNIIEEEVLIAEKDGSIQINMDIENEDNLPIKMKFSSSDSNVATATLGIIDGNGVVKTAAQIEEKKNLMSDTDEADKIKVPTNTAIITAKNWGECEITVSIGKLTDKVKVINADKKIAYTYDDGTFIYTKELLKGLKKENVKATFFVIGRIAKRDDVNFEGLKQAIKDGHEIGNHTYNHKAGADTLMKELKKTDDVIIKAGGKETTLMRPPGGRINDKTLDCGKSVIMWSIDTLDWKNKNAKKLTETLVNDVKNNDIILLHELYKESVEGSLAAIQPLKEKGFMFVTTSELIGEMHKDTVYRKGKGKLKTQVLK